MRIFRLVVIVIVLLIIASIIYGIGVVIGNAKGCYAADYRVYTENGGMNVTERGISEGHKSYHTLGLLAGVEGLMRGEPADEDDEIFQYGYSVRIEDCYQLTDWLAPYVGLGYNNLDRDTPAKYSGDSDFEETIYLLSASAGIRMDWQMPRFVSSVYLDLGANYPFYSNIDSGGIGPELGVGFTIGRFDVGYRFKEVRFNGNDDLSFYFSGIQLGWAF